jgi:hypothetical protein
MVEATAVRAAVLMLCVVSAPAIDVLAAPAWEGGAKERLWVTVQQTGT